MTRHQKYDEGDVFGAQALAVGNITEEFVDPGTVNTQVNCKQIHNMGDKFSSVFHARQS